MARPSALKDAMKALAIAFLILGVTASSLVAGDARCRPVPGTDDLSRYVATKATAGRPDNAAGRLRTNHGNRSHNRHTNDVSRQQRPHSR